jgi:hypothetical protein
MLENSKGLAVDSRDVAEVLDRAVKKAIVRTQQKLSAVISEKGTNVFESFSQEIIKDAIGFINGFQDDYTIVPPGTRFFRRGAGCSVVVVEEPPAIRTLKFSSYVDDQSKPHELLTRSLALPYVVFVFKFTHVDNHVVFHSVSMGFRTKPVTALTDTLGHSILPNTHPSGIICMGDKDNKMSPMARLTAMGLKTITDYTNSFLRLFWESSFSYDYLDSYRNIKKLYPQFANLSTWQEASLNDPTFVLRVDYGNFCTIDKLVNNFLAEPSAFAKSFENRIRNKIFLLMQNMCGLVNSLKLEDYRSSAYEAGLIREFMEIFLQSATEDLRRMYEGKLTGILRDIERKTAEVANQLLKADSVPADIRNPW